MFKSDVSAAVAVAVIDAKAPQRELSSEEQVLICWKLRYRFGRMRFFRQRTMRDYIVLHKSITSLFYLLLHNADRALFSLSTHLKRSSLFSAVDVKEMY